MNRFGGGRSGGGRGGRSFGGRDGGRPEMFRATCAECGAGCEVPFRPSGDRPVYCSECFENVEPEPRRDFGRNDRRDRDFGRNDRRGGRDDFAEKRMFSATCDECGATCEVPFKPTGEKPIFCDECFGSQKKQPKGDDLRFALEQMNDKLDKIVKLLETAGLKKEVPVIKPIKTPKVEVIEEVAEVVAPVKEKAKKAAKETPAKEKAAPKKTTKKKA